MIFRFSKNTPTALGPSQIHKNA